MTSCQQIGFRNATELRYELGAIDKGVPDHPQADFY